MEASGKIMKGKSSLGESIRGSMDNSMGFTKARGRRHQHWGLCQWRSGTTGQARHALGDGGCMLGIGPRGNGGVSGLGDAPSVVAGFGDVASPTDGLSGAPSMSGVDVDAGGHSLGDTLGMASGGLGDAGEKNIDTHARSGAGACSSGLLGDILEH
ncbi:unnamed protein product [Ilex paraguariensis]|uniref:Uncharacterized protein n=1 Tax=Ilex paraguariensis TaxID=185542 RepID=A0ABC8UBI0_9AQUA